MCGITGIFAFNQIGRMNMINLAKATSAIASRGPDNQGIYHDDFVGLGHRRLSVIDVSAEANQPMTDDSGRYKIVYNGEIYNFRTIRAGLEAKGVSFKTNSDTEVLLYAYIHYGAACLDMLNGFFAFAIYDIQNAELFIARDRFGIKPLHYYADEDKFLFASEVKSLFTYGIEKKLDVNALYSYLQLNYLPAPQSMIQGVKKLEPGCYLKIKKKTVEQTRYYTTAINAADSSFDVSKDKFVDLMESAVTDRLVSDVPLGTFLSGGIDSSIISAIAAKHVPDLKTFSIGFKEESFFDETDYANAVAKHLNTDHTVFKLSNADLYQHVFDILDCMDEPFADSSAIAVYILSRETKKHVTVALSGDGADELFAGYNKHEAALRMINGGTSANVLKGMLPLWNLLPKSRNNFITNKFRQFQRFAKAMKLSPKDRYWAWASISDADYAKNILTEEQHNQLDLVQFDSLKSNLTKAFAGKEQISQTLLADLNMVLPNDMLTKVDLMSMANSLEIRVPFLDHRVVEFAFGLPDSHKITSDIRKRIVQESFRSWLPGKIYKRPKHGFEVPLLKWFRTEMRSLIENDLLEDDFIVAQGVFDLAQIQLLKKKLFSRNPEDVHAKIWALIVFQWWWKKYFLD